MKTYLTLRQAQALGYKYMCPDGSERCEKLSDIKDFMDEGYEEAELMSLDTEHLVLNAEDIVMDAIENQEIFDEGDAVPDSAMEEFKEACKKFNEAVHDSSTTYQGTGEYIKLTTKQ